MVSTGPNYRYERFKQSNYDPASFPGPVAGGEVNFNYEFTDLDGEKVYLNDYQGKWLVIECGSLTCPMYVKDINAFQELQDAYPEIEWLVVYIREAHPGNKLKQADSIEEKIAYAKRSQNDYGERRKIVVDDLAGSWHHDWGLWPNFVYVINPDGICVYRADWSMAEKFADVLENRDNLNTAERVSHMGSAPWVFIPVTLKGGWLAFWDLIKIMPKALSAIIIHRIKATRSNT